MKRLKIFTGIYLTVWSLIIGIATAAYLDLVNWVIDFFWKLLPSALGIADVWRPLFICLPLSIIVGLSQAKLGAYPLTIAQILDEMRIKGYFSYQRWWKILFSALLILGAGASVGPEASASGLVAGMIYWLGCRYKLIRTQESALLEEPWHQQLRIIWLSRTSKCLVSQPLATFFKNKRQQKIFYACWTFVGLIGCGIFFYIFPQEGVFGIHHPKINWQWQGLLGVLPAIIVGWLFGYFFVKLGQFSERWLGRDRHHLLKAIAGGLILVLAAAFSPMSLFSGEFSIIPFAHSSLQLAPAFLFVLAILKATITNLGFSLGWRGGTIFPAIFSSLAIGAWLAHFIPWMPRLTVSLVVASSLTVILEKPVLTAVLLWLLLPIQFSILILLTCLLVGQVNKRVNFLKL